MAAFSKLDPSRCLALSVEDPAAIAPSILRSTDVRDKMAFRAFSPLPLLLPLSCLLAAEASRSLAWLRSGIYLIYPQTELSLSLPLALCSWQVLI